jgi:hypothetical protein
MLKEQCDGLETLIHPRVAADGSILAWARRASRAMPMAAGPTLTATSAKETLNKQLGTGVATNPLTSASKKAKTNAKGPSDFRTRVHRSDLL